MRDTLYNSLRAQSSLAPTAVAADGATNGSAVHLGLNKQNFRVAMVVAYAGTVTDGAYAISVEESADGSTGWAAVPAARLQGTATLDATGEVGELGVIPDPAKPYLRAVATASDVTTGGTVGALILLGTPGQEPVIR